MPTKGYPLWINKKLVIEWWGSYRNESLSKDVSWDEKYTKVTGAKLSISVKANGRTNVVFYINENEAARFHWEIWEDLVTKTAEADVTGNLINGPNAFRVNFYKDPIHLVEVYTVFTASLTVTYTGEPPKVKPWWEKYAVPLAVGGVGVLVLLALASRRPTIYYAPPPYYERR